MQTAETVMHLWGAVVVDLDSIGTYLGVYCAYYVGLKYKSDAHSELRII